MKTANYLFTVLTLSILLFTTGCGTPSSKSAEPETPPVITNTPTPTPDTTDSSHKEDSSYQTDSSHDKNISHKDSISHEEAVLGTEHSSSDKELNDLYTKGSKIFSTHKDIWDKVFGLIEKTTAENNKNMEYSDYLTRTIEKHKDSFTEDEHKILKDDLNKIKELETKISDLQNDQLK